MFPPRAEAGRPASFAAGRQSPAFLPKSGEGPAVRLSPGRRAAVPRRDREPCTPGAGRTRKLPGQGSRLRLPRLNRRAAQAPGRGIRRAGLFLPLAGRAPCCGRGSLPTAPGCRETGPFPRIDRAGRRWYTEREESGIPAKAVKRRASSCGFPPSAPFAPARGAGGRGEPVRPSTFCVRKGAVRYAQ